ncbi:hypothetical protein [Cupriavidus sp. TMH.W2]|uniref:hypothetical protein n=1 Tax=Cupriavidus sp. TMH.W2 TaxID=3434465 RepID=UPI003D76BA32
MTTTHRPLSPLDQIEFLGNPTELPLPPFPVGTDVELNPNRMHPSDLAYYQRCAIRFLVRTTRRIIRGLRRQGYLKEPLNSPLSKTSREQILEIIAMIQASHTMQIAGWKPRGMHVVGTLGNQCYLRNGQCHSGVSYDAFILFRARVHEQDVVYIHPEAIISGNALRASQRHISGESQPD